MGNNLETVRKEIDKVDKDFLLLQKRMDLVSKVVIKSKPVKRFWINPVKKKLSKCPFNCQTRV